MEERPPIGHADGDGGVIIRPSKYRGPLPTIPPESKLVAGDALLYKNKRFVVGFTKFPDIGEARSNLVSTLDGGQGFSRVKRLV